MNLATYIRDVDGFLGVAKLYRCEGGELPAHVIVSAVTVPITGPETYIFEANDAGEILNWMELYGSYRGGLDHAEALRGAGYESA